MPDTMTKRSSDSSERNNTSPQQLPPSNKKQVHLEMPLDTKNAGWLPVHFETTKEKQLFQEVFVPTGGGDIGFQIKSGPLLRVHSHVLEKTPGFLDQIRERCKPLPLYIEQPTRETSALSTKTVKGWLLKKGLKRLAADINFASFAVDLDTPDYDLTRLGGHSTAEPMALLGSLQRKGRPCRTSLFKEITLGMRPRWTFSP